ncbi:hypothetical protein Poli38472_004848 [Pythium oligandrum]|uniref:Uncharacterized protein n=1 Tax=Pythium oligandrum TaxID=41045 RepID=A0A8K1CB28_PYTOL|nr:hypothetical protein Poli38472_004848 [Pythium oligandrum]|eukprot:TMW59779.1 hypothetical protein Poli38472_004848 [Pythium oligandrum]
MEMTAEDHAALHAVLAFADEFVWNEALTSSQETNESPVPSSPPRLSLHESSWSTDTGNTTPPRESPTASSAQRTKKRQSPNRSRNRQRQELLALRETVKELEGVLANLRHKAIVRAAKEDPAKVALAKSMASVWEAMADRQYKQRERVEMENARLRNMLEDRVRLLDSLKRQMEKKPKGIDRILPLVMTKQPLLLNKASLPTATLYDELLATLPTMYEQLDSVFTDPRFQELSPSYRDIRIRDEPEKTQPLAIEVVDCRIFPFGADATSKAVWQLMVTPSSGSACNFHGEGKSTEDILTQKFAASVHLGEVQGRLRGHVVARRYVENERVVMVWASVVTPEVISSVPMDGVVTRQKGWVVIERLAKSQNGSVDRRATQFQSFRVSVSEADESVSDQLAKLNLVTDFERKTTALHLESGHRTIENILLGEWKGQAVACFT